VLPVHVPCTVPRCTGRSAAPLPLLPPPPPLRGSRQSHPPPARAQARDTYRSFVELVRREHGQPGRVKDGVFGAMMQVGLVNDGPVTFILDSETQD
jgi:hypothetical protein